MNASNSPRTGQVPVAVDGSSGACAAHAHCPVTVVHAPRRAPAKPGMDDVTADQRIVLTF